VRYLVLISFMVLAAWMDVDGWARWDLGLKSAWGGEPLRLGSCGVIVDRGGNEATFQVTEFVPGRRYAFETGLSGARLRVRRLIVGTDPTTFRHEASFHGVGAPLWAWQFGGGLRQALPPTMAKLAATAEAGAP
jgi:hypothetical protein